MGHHVPLPANVEVVGKLIVNDAAGHAFMTAYSRQKETNRNYLAFQKMCRKTYEQNDKMITTKLVLRSVCLCGSRINTTL